MSQRLTHAVLLIACAALLLVASRMDYPADAFAAEYSRWASMVNARRGGTLDAREARQWQEVKQRWRALEKAVDGYYAER